MSRLSASSCMARMRKATDTSMRREQDLSRRPCCRCSNAPHGQSPWPQRPTGQTQDRFGSTSVRGCAACGGEGAALCAICIHCLRVSMRSWGAVGAAQRGAVSVPCVGSPSPPADDFPTGSSSWTGLRGSSVTRSGGAFERENIHISPLMARGQWAKRGYPAAALPNMCSPRIVCHRSSRSRCRRHVRLEYTLRVMAQSAMSKVTHELLAGGEPVMERVVLGLAPLPAARRQKISLPWLPDEPPQHPQPACSALVVIFHDRYGDAPTRARRSATNLCLCVPRIQPSIANTTWDNTVSIVPLSVRPATRETAARS